MGGSLNPTASSKYFASTRDHMAGMKGQTIAQIELFTRTADYPVGVYTLPKHLDEKVARLQLKKLNAQLTVLTEQQAAYIGVPVEGPYKAVHYRY